MKLLLVILTLFSTNVMAQDLGLTDAYRSMKKEVINKCPVSDKISYYDPFDHYPKKVLEGLGIKYKEVVNLFAGETLYYADGKLSDFIAIYIVSTLLPSDFKAPTYFYNLKAKDFECKKEGDNFELKVTYNLGTSSFIFKIDENNSIVSLYKVIRGDGMKVSVDTWDDGIASFRGAIPLEYGIMDSLF